MFPEKVSIRVITLSDRASRGEYKDLSGPEIVSLCSQYFSEKGYKIEISKQLIPDDPDQLRILIRKAVDDSINLIFTTGGTGLGPRDLTPDILKEMFKKEIPGIMEMIRVKYGMQKPNALVSRSIAGLIGQSLVYALPGSVKAVREYCGEILPTTLHSIRMVHGIDDHS